MQGCKFSKDLLVFKINALNLAVLDSGCCFF